MHNAEPSTSSAPDVESGYSRPYRGYILGALAMLYVLNTMDRFMIGVLVQPIKAEFGLTDAQIGALGGLAFALFYVAFGLPIAKLADRHNRVTIISACVAVWSAATAACGLATGFVHLLIARVFVAIGESGGVPPATSMISDIWGPKKRASAMAFFVAGGPIGTALGLLLAGWINELWGWRAAFLCLGVPGVIVALVIKLTIREPRRGLSESREAPGEASTVLSVARLILARPTFVLIMLATAMTSVIINGLGVWLPAFFMRSHGLSSGMAGSWIAALNVVGTVGGAVIGGLITDRLVVRDRRWAMWVPAIAVALGAPMLLAGFLTHELGLAIACFTLPKLFLGITFGPIYSTLPALVGLRMRAMAMSIFLLFSNLVGLGLGPLVVGLISDSFGGSGPNSLRYALAFIMPPALLVSAGLFFLAATRLRKDLSNAPA